ncbi:MAG: hypothetical protein V4579_03405 [Pseudomonadota bacterium]
MRRSRNIAGAIAALLIAAQALAQDAAGNRILAKVGEDEILYKDVQSEMAGADLPANLRKAAEQATLQGMIDRKLLAAEALRRKLDATPVGAMTLKRADDLALIAVLERNVTAGLPQVPREEVVKYVADHPATFANRKRIWVDQLQVAAIDPEIVKMLEPLNTMEEITALFDRTQITYIRSANVLDTSNMDPQAALALSKMGTNSVFITPKGGGALEVSRIASIRVEPITGAAAEQSAGRYLSQARTTAAAHAAMKKIIDAGQSKVRLNPKYVTPGT